LPFQAVGVRLANWRAEISNPVSKEIQMKNRVLSSTPLMLAFALALASTPAMAQGRGNGNGHGNGKAKSEQTRKAAEERRPVLQRRADDDQDDDRYDDDRYEDTYGVYSNGQRRSVPPGWCKGKGNPHNTVENCGYGNDRYNATYSRSGSSYEASHADFHRYLDDKYRSLASRNPLDVRRQLELRAQKSAEHQRWHDQAGIRHQ
jgi:hypothetical protein